MTKLEELLNKSGNKRGIIHGLRGDRIYGIYHDIKKRYSTPIEAANAYDNFILSRNLNHTTNKMLTGV